MHVLCQNTVYVSNEHFTEDCYEVSYRYEMLGAKFWKEETKTRCCSRNIPTFLAPLGFFKPSSARNFGIFLEQHLVLVENSSFAVIQGNPFVSPPRSRLKIQTVDIQK